MFQSSTLPCVTIAILFATFGFTSQAFAQATGGAAASACIDFKPFDSTYLPSTAFGPESADPNLSLWPSNWSFRVEDPYDFTPSYYYDELDRIYGNNDTYMMMMTDVFLTNTSPIVHGTLTIEAMHGNTPNFDYVIWNESNTAIIASGTYTHPTSVPTNTSYTATISFTPPTVTIPGYGTFPGKVGEVHIVGLGNEMGFLEVCMS